MKPFDITIDKIAEYGVGNNSSYHLSYTLDNLYVYYDKDRSYHKDISKNGVLTPHTEPTSSIINSNGVRTTVSRGKIRCEKCGVWTTNVEVCKCLLQNNVGEIKFRIGGIYGNSFTSKLLHYSTGRCITKKELLVIKNLSVECRGGLAPYYSNIEQALACGLYMRFLEIINWDASSKSDIMSKLVWDVKLLKNIYEGYEATIDDISRYSSNIRFTFSMESSKAEMFLSAADNYMELMRLIELEDIDGIMKFHENYKPKPIDKREDVFDLNRIFGYDDIVLVSSRKLTNTTAVMSKESTSGFLLKNKIISFYGVLVMEYSNTKYFDSGATGITPAKDSTLKRAKSLLKTAINKTNKLYGDDVR